MQRARGGNPRGPDDPVQIGVAELLALLVLVAARKDAW